MLTQLENDNVKDIYEQIAPQFNNTRQYRWSWVNEFLNTLENNSIVLDLGCGNGRNMQHNNLNFIGIDNCKNFINICKEKNLNVINSNPNLFISFNYFRNLFFSKFKFKN